MGEKVCVPYCDRKVPVGSNEMPLLTSGEPKKGKRRLQEEMKEDGQRETLPVDGAACNAA